MVEGGKLTIRRAIYGDIPPEGWTTPKEQTVDVTRILRASGFIKKVAGYDDFFRRCVH
jgi:hypothetical protein